MISSELMHDTADLRDFVGAPGPYFSVMVPTPSRFNDAAHRFEVNWKNALAALDKYWPRTELATVDTAVRSLPHDAGASLVVLHAMGGRTHLEFLDEPVDQVRTTEGNAPRLAPVLEARQRALSHVVVETDRAGADLTAFDGGRVLSTEQVDGDTEHIHRGHPGGWSQRRFQQRAENTWEHNADDVAAAVTRLAEKVHATMVFVAGDVRARSLVVDALPERIANHTMRIDEGSPDAVADAVVRHLSDHVASGIRDLADHVRNRLGTGMATVVQAEVMDALADGRVEHLLVHDDGDDTVLTERSVAGTPAGTRLVDAAIVGALQSDAKITVVPRLAMLDGPVAAILRW